MQQHMAAHRTQEKKLAQLSEQDLKWQHDNDHYEQDDVDSGSTGKRSRRKAAQKYVISFAVFLHVAIVYACMLLYLIVDISNSVESAQRNILYTSGNILCTSHISSVP